MTTASDVLRVAVSQIGYVETPSNITRYWAELEPGLQGNPWCAAFVSWVFKHAGLPLPAMGKPYGFVYVPNAVNYAKTHGLWDESGHYAPGDVVCYGNGAHTGIIATDDGTTMAVYEGNTSPDNGAGSQTNGGGVYLRHRPHGTWVNGVVKTSKLLAAPQPAPARPTAPTPPTPTHPEATMYLIQAPPNPKVYKTDGFQKRWIGPGEYGDWVKVTGRRAVAVSQGTIDAIPDAAVKP